MHFFCLAVTSYIPHASDALKDIINLPSLISIRIVHADYQWRADLPFHFPAHVSIRRMLKYRENDFKCQLNKYLAEKGSHEAVWDGF